MMLQAFDFLMSIYQNVLLIYVLKKQFVQIHHSFLWEAGFIIIPSILLFCVQALHLPIPDTIFLFAYLFYVKATTHENLVTCIFWVAIDSFLLLGTLSLVSSFFDIQIDLNGGVLSASPEIQVIYTLTGNAAITVVLCLAARVKNPKRLVKQREVMLYLLMLLLCFGISECFFIARISEKPHLYLLIGSACSFLVMIMIIILYERMIQSAIEIKQENLSARTMKLTSGYVDELKTIYKDMLSEQHDLRHRVTIVEELLSSPSIQEEQRQEALKMLGNSPTSSLYITGIISVDAILKAKSTIMENAGIIFDFDEYPLAPLQIPEQDFCILLGNLLDNAIDGVMCLPASASSRRIHLSFSKVWNMLFISCINDTDTSKLKRDGSHFISTKENPEIHGFGIISMQKIVARAGGTIEFDIKDNQFGVEIMLGGVSPC